MSEAQRSEVKCSVVSDSFQPQGLLPTRLLCPWDFPGKSTGVGCHKKAEYGIIDAFKLLHWRRLLRVLWSARRSNQSILKEIDPEYSLEGLMLKLQYFGLDAKNQLIRKDPDARKD